MRLERLSRGHDRATFACGTPELDLYLQERASQDVRRGVATCLVAVEEGSPLVLGYYTLAAGAVLLADVPEAIGRRLPRYPDLPVARLGRLAVDRRRQGRGLGAALVFDAVARVARSDLAAFALLVDAKDERAAAFYRRLGFVDLGRSGLRLALAVPRR